MKNLLNLLIFITITFLGCDKNDGGINFEDVIAEKATEITSSGFIANWQIVQNADSYEIEVASDNSFTAIKKTQNVSGAENNLVSVSSLNANEQYYYRVRYIIGQDYSSYSNVIDVKTYSDIVSLDASNITPTGFQANWALVEGAEKYEIEIATDDGFLNVVKTKIINDSKTDSLIIDDLEKDVNYKYHVRYYKELIPSHFSNTINVTTNHVDFTEITATEATKVTIYGFQANWEPVSFAEKYELEVSTEIGFSEIEKTLEIEGTEMDSIIVDGLQKDITYYYRLSYYVWGKKSEYSNSIKVTTNLHDEDLTIETNGITTKATITYKLDYEGKAPVVLFLHMGGANRYEWTNNDLYNMCIDSGYVALAYDLRGHGQSGGSINWDTFTTDPTILPKDLEEVISFLQTMDFIDNDRIGIVGGSMGAILGTGATKYPHVKCAVSITSFYDAVDALYGVSGINTVFYLAGEYDNSNESELLYEATNEPKKIKIIEGSSSHSAALINTDELRIEVFNWIEEYL